jgi:cell division protein FtsQ
LQQVAARDFADAQLVDPRQLPVPVRSLSRRARINFRQAWILHRKLILRAAAAAAVLTMAVGLYEARDLVAAGAARVSDMAQGEFAKAGFGISKINITGQVLTSVAEVVTALAVP